MHEVAGVTRRLERWPGSQQVELGSRLMAARRKASQEPAPETWASRQDPGEGHQAPLSEGECSRRWRLQGP